jgi:propionyl-CoA synthetase
LGAVHSVVFGGFAPAELAARIDDAKPKVIVSASCGLEPTRIVEYKPMLDESISLATHKPSRCIILQREQHQVELGPLDMDWKDAMAMAEPAECVSVAATDPLYILYTSGTTGKPKGIVRDNGGHAVALTWSMKNVYNIEAGDMWWSASDVGWVVGHSYIVYAPLFAGATTIVFEGKPVGTPDAGTFWRVIEKYGVKGLFTAPTAIRAIRKEDYNGDFIKKTDLSKFENLFLAGERLDPDTYHWATENLGVPVVDNWWQTETGWPIASNLRGLEPMPIVRPPPARVNEPVALLLKVMAPMAPTVELFVLVPLVPAYSTSTPVTGAKASCQFAVSVQFPLPPVQVAMVA